jgi:hypothetical protein
MPDHGIYILSGSVIEVETHAEGELLLVRYASADDKDAWNKLTDETILEWGCSWTGGSHAGVNDGDLQWPARDVLSEAYNLACRMRDSAVPVPSNIVPNGEGGIVFEWRRGPFFRVVEMGSDRSLEVRQFERSKLVLRFPLVST